MNKNQKKPYYNKYALLLIPHINGIIKYINTYGEKRGQDLRRTKMGDYLRRLLIAGLIGLCISLLFLGGKHPQASMIDGKQKNSNWIWPTEGVITDTFGTRNGKHKGIDIAAENGTPIFAVDNGVVEKSYYSSTYGNVIFLKHPNQYVSVYAHLNDRLAFEGQTVQQGDMIGKMGKTGQATGVHLHFEIHKMEWTYDKKFALDPEGLLGKVMVGEVVQASLTANEKKVLEASTRMQIESESSETQHESYFVKEGDTLWSIAEKNNMTVELLQNLNGMKNTNIYIGQKLIISKTLNKKYVVKEGDTLSSISKANHLTVEQIKQLNNLSSDLIKPNQFLRIPE
jgi:murein DD-endopeptidase MepM/ murein hydrolase activator NlpD